MLHCLSLRRKLFGMLYRKKLSFTVCILGYSFDSDLTAYQVNAHHLAQHFQHISHEYFDTAIAGCYTYTYLPNIEIYNLFTGHNSGLFMDEEPTTRDCFYANQLFVNQGNSTVMELVRKYFDDVEAQAPAKSQDADAWDFDGALRFIPVRTLQYGVLIKSHILSCIVDNSVPNYPNHGDVQTCNVSIRTGPTYRTHGNSLHLCLNMNEMAVLSVFFVAILNYVSVCETTSFIFKPARPKLTRKRTRNTVVCCARRSTTTICSRAWTARMSATFPMTSSDSRNSTV